MDTTTHELSYIEVKKGDELIIGDPCYRGEHSFKTTNLKEGKYNVFVEVSDEGDWGKRVAILRILHETFEEEPEYDEIQELGVDAGLMSININSLFHEYEGYWEYIPDGTIGLGRDGKLTTFKDRKDLSIDEINRGYSIARNINKQQVCSGSGFGDGGYPISVGEDEDGNLVAAKIQFIWDEDEEDDFEDYGDDDADEEFED